MAKTRKPFKANKGFFLYRELIESAAFRSLTKNAMLVYFRFLLKRVLQDNKGTGGKPGKRKNRHVVVNNGDIVFPYREAKKQLGLNAATFKRSLEKLVECGFINIIHAGSAYEGD